MKKTALMLALAMPLLTMAQDIATRADGFLNTLTTNKQFAGDVLIASKGKVIFQKAYGYADAANKRPNTLQTEFRAGSLTKMFTSALVLQLVEAGRLKLSDPVSKYVPKLAHVNGITLKQLLSHTSGIAGSTDPAAITTTQLVEGFKSQPQAFTPGTRFEYNNFNYILLAYIAQKVTGVPYETLVKQRVFNKAGMMHTGIDHEGRRYADAALGHTYDPQTQQIVPMTGGNVSAASGAGAMYTTVGDLLKFVEAIKANKIFSAATFKLATTPVQPGYGLGWIIGDDPQHPKIGHSGSIEGFRGELMYFPKDDLAVIFLSNLLPLVDSHVERALTAAAFGQPYQVEGPKKEITLSPDVLARYVGTYTSEGGNMVVSVQDGKLMVLAPGGDTAELAPLSESKFFVKGPEIGVEFKQEDGKVTAMSVDMHGGITFKRAN